MYKNFLRPLLFSFDPEYIHNFTIRTLAWSTQHSRILKSISAKCQLYDSRLEIRCFGLSFPNPIGLAAGLDKNARAILAWQALGFGAIEVGSITAYPQKGNPKPRLFRLKKDKALINRFGFNNDGAESIAHRLRTRKSQILVPLGINLGKSKVIPLEKASEDYLDSLKLLFDYGDYFVVNVSSPNTESLRKLQHKEYLAELLSTLSSFVASRKPLLLKISPDLSWPEFDDVIELCATYNISGLILTNTTTSRVGLKTLTNKTGGLSGAPLKNLSVEFLLYAYKNSGSKLKLISVGGIFTAEDVYERLKAGASLVQVYTGFVYEGPFMLHKINTRLLELLARDKIARLEDVIGQSS